MANHFRSKERDLAWLQTYGRIEDFGRVPGTNDLQWFHEFFEIDIIESKWPCAWFTALQEMTSCTSCNVVIHSNKFWGTFSWRWKGSTIQSCIRKEMPSYRLHTLDPKINSHFFLNFFSTKKQGTHQGSGNNIIIFRVPNLIKCDNYVPQW